MIDNENCASLYSNRKLMIRLLTIVRFALKTFNEVYDDDDHGDDDAVGNCGT